MLIGRLLVMDFTGSGEWCAAALLKSVLIFAMDEFNGAAGILIVLASDGLPSRISVASTSPFGPTMTNAPANPLLRLVSILSAILRKAAAWSVISARRRSGQAAAVRHAIALELGVSFELDGQRVVAFPQPQRLLEAAELPGVGAEKAQRLRAVAAAALGGGLDVERLHALGPQASWTAVQQLPGIGPFYASLIVLRAAGFADAAMPMAEPRMLAHLARYYDLATPATLEQYAVIAERWRPFRTWTTVLVRIAGERERGLRG